MFESPANYRTCPMRLGICNSSHLPAVITFYHLKTRCSPVQGELHVCWNRWSVLKQFHFSHTTIWNKTESPFSTFQDSAQISLIKNIIFEEIARFLHMNIKELYVQLPTLPHLIYVKLNEKICPIEIGRCYINTSVGHLEITIITLFIKVTCIYLETSFQKPNERLSLITSLYVHL